MASNLLENACPALNRYPVKNCYDKGNSSDVLLSIQSDGSYRTFESNIVSKIKSKESMN